MDNLSTRTLSIVYQEQPYNAGTPLPLLRSSFVTPQERFFARSHGDTPTIDSASYRLRITGSVRNYLEFSLAELCDRFPSHTVMATLQCTGSRRNELAEIRPIPGELPWGGEPISNATWRGIALRDVLAVADIEPEARYVAFAGLDEVLNDGEQVGFGSSIALEKALSPEVLLAYEMNHQPLTPDHGAPLRVIVPGYIGARSVKWLGAITLQSEPSHNYFQAKAYKLFPSYVTEVAKADASQGQTLESLPLNSVICVPENGATLPARPLSIRGYAMTGGDNPIERVEVSTDRGVTWTNARITERADPWSWCFWEHTVNLLQGKHMLCVRAYDTAGRSQPADRRQVWNLKGYANNAWHRIHVFIA